MPTNFIYAFAIFLISSGFALAEVRVYRPDGTLQCKMGRERILADDRAVLEQLGAKVLSAEKRVVPVKIIAVCGAPTGQSNTFVISDEDWTKVQRGFVGPAGFGEWTYDAKTTTVYKYDGTLQCGLGQEITLDEMAKELLDAGIQIISRQKSHDGLMHIALCGSASGQINAFEIATADLPKATALGFSYLAKPQHARADDRIKPLANGGMPGPWPFPW
jgi:hypothetical protein